MSMQQYRTLQRAIAMVVAASLSGLALMASAAPPGNSSQGDGGVSAFYSWTGDVPRQPGTLLRHEPLREGLMLENASSGLRILHSSTDGIGGQAPVSVSGAVFLPKGTAPAAGWPIVAWAHGTVGIADVMRPVVARTLATRHRLSQRLARAGLCDCRFRLPGTGNAGWSPLSRSTPPSLQHSRQRARGAEWIAGFGKFCRGDRSVPRRRRRVLCSGLRAGLRARYQSSRNGRHRRAVLFDRRPRQVGRPPGRHGRSDDSLHDAAHAFRATGGAGT